MKGTRGATVWAVVAALGLSACGSGSDRPAASKTNAVPQASTAPTPARHRAKAAKRKTRPPAMKATTSTTAARPAPATVSARKRTADDKAKNQPPPTSGGAAIAPKTPQAKAKLERSQNVASARRSNRSRAKH